MTVTTATNLPGSCYGPVLTEDKLTAYRELVNGLPAGQIKDVLLRCLKCIDIWWALPESTRATKQTYESLRGGKKHEIGIVPLEQEHIAALYDVTPWPQEWMAWRDMLMALPNGSPVETYSRVKCPDGIERTIASLTYTNTTDQKLFDAALHLLWYVGELANDREPMTADKLVAVE